VATPKVPPLSAAVQLAEVLDSPEIAALVFELEATRWTGRPGYPIRSMIGMALAKSIYAVPTWSRTCRLVCEHAALAATIAPTGDVPSVYACYRFTAKLRTYGGMLARCIDGVTASLREQLPELGRNIAIDGSDMPALRERAAVRLQGWPRARRLRVLRSGRKLGPSFGRLDAQGRRVLRLQARHGRLHCDGSSARVGRAHGALIDVARARGFAVETAALDKGYDVGPVYDGCEARDVRPIIPLRETPGVKRGDHKPPTCEHGTWTFRWVRQQARREQVALPDRRVQARVRLGQGRPPASADPARGSALRCSLSPPCRC